MHVRASSLSLLALLTLVSSACGYHALYGGNSADPSGSKLHVVLVRSVVADAIASDEVVSGVREELAKDGALAAGDGYPRVEIEVLRIDESSDGITASRAASGALTPVARGTEVGLVARAWVALSQGAEKVRDTGDVRALDLVSSRESTPTTQPAGDSSGSGARDLLTHGDALRAVGRRVGVQLARKILGHPIAADESLGRER